MTGKGNSISTCFCKPRSYDMHIAQPSPVLPIFAIIMWVDAASKHYFIRVGTDICFRIRIKLTTRDAVDDGVTDNNWLTLQSVSKVVTLRTSQKTVGIHFVRCITKKMQFPWSITLHRQKTLLMKNRWIGDSRWGWWSRSRQDTWHASTWTLLLLSVTFLVFFSFCSKRSFPLADWITCARFPLLYAFDLHPWKRMK